MVPSVKGQARVVKCSGRGGPGTEVIKLFPCSTQLSSKLILLINVKMPTIVGILTFISRINTTSESLKSKKNQCFSAFNSRELAH